MTPERWQQVKEIFDAAKGRDPEQRASFLDQACAGGESVRREVESLLAAHDEAPDFMDKPAVNNILAARPRLSAGRRLGPFEVISLLGEGGMGEVYLANDTRLGRKVAIKLLLPTSVADEQARKRLIREARLAAKLDHPNICAIHEVGEDSGQSYIIMQYVEGETLGARLKRNDLSLAETLSTATQIADALAEAHDRGIVHRDIKPQNIIVTPRQHVKVMDFGLAKTVREAQAVESEAATQSLLSKPGLVVGTVPYMSPEQIRGEALDARTDIWSLGCVLYEMLTGRAPFAGKTGADVLVAIVEREPPPLKSLAAEQIPAELERIVTMTLRKKPEERYQTSKELLVDLRRLRQKLEFESHPERSAPPEARVEAATAKVADRSTAKRMGQLRHTLSARRAVIHAAVLVTLMLGAPAYVWYWRQTPVAPQPEINSLAVLPLKALDAGENYLGLGVADAVIRRINQTGTLIVRPTSAVRRYLNEETDALTAARQLNADAVLEGSVQRADDRLRVSVNLLRTSDGTSLWTDSFDMRMTDIFTIQDTISQQVASRLQLKLDPAQQARLDKRYTSNPEAYEYYAKGRTNLERVTTAVGDRQPAEAAISYFKKAVELDPRYALAYAALGDAYMQMANFNDPDNPAWVGLAQQALTQAESLDSQLAEIHVVRFEFYFSRYGGWDLARAAREARQALALNPSVGHMGLGTIYDHLGLDGATGLRETQRALEIDPTNTFIQARLVESYELYGKFDAAIDTHRRFFGTAGPPFSLIKKGKLDEAQSMLEEAVKKNSGDLRARGRLALIFALKGKFQEAEAAIPPILEQARNNRSYHHITYDIACVYALEGKTDEAVKWLRTTAETGMPNLPLFERDQHLDRIRREPAFIQFMQEFRPRWEEYRRGSA